MCGTPPLDQFDAPARCDQSRIDGIDAIFREGLQDASNRRRDQQVDVMLGKLTLELQLDRTNPSLEQLAVQRSLAATLVR